MITGHEYDGTKSISGFHAFLFESMVWLGLFAVPPLLAFLNWKRRSNNHRKAIRNTIMET
jgi:hypothetical protein